MSLSISNISPLVGIFVRNDSIKYHERIPEKDTIHNTINARRQRDFCWQFIIFNGLRITRKLFVSFLFERAEISTWGVRL